MPRDAMRGRNRIPRERRQFAGREGGVWPVNVLRRNGVLVNGQNEDGRARRGIDRPDTYQGPLPPGANFD